MMSMVERLAGFLAGWLVVSTFCVSAFAQPVDENVPATAWCVLDRSPFLAELSLPEELACCFDQDGNGLDDEIERQLAKCLTPEFRFDSREDDRRADEPNSVFSSYRIQFDTIKIRFAALFRWDEE